MRITARNLLEKAPAQCQADAEQKTELRQPLDHCHRAIDLFPLVALRTGQHHPLASQRPAAPAVGVQAKAALVGPPDLHRAILGPIKFFEVFLQSGAKRRRGRRILMDVAGARNPERATDFSQPVIKRLDRSLDAVGFLQPGGHLARSAPAPGFEAGLICASSSWLRPNLVRFLARPQLAPTQLRPSSHTYRVLLRVGIRHRAVDWLG